MSATVRRGKRSANLTTEQWAGALDQFGDEGYVIVPGLLDPSTDLQPVIDEYGELIDSIYVTAVRQGQAMPHHGPGSVADRLHQLIRETDGALFQHFDISLPLDEDIRPDTPLHLGPAVFGLLTNAKLLDAVEMFIGPEICANPVQHLRVKPPEREISEEKRRHTLVGSTFWHQDQAVITSESDGSDVLSVWLPLADVSADNGCLVVVPGSHRDGLTRHCRTPRFNGIPDELLGDERRPLPMRAGDVLFLHKLTKHASQPNTSSALRWSFDLRYNPIGQPTGRPWFPDFVARSRSHPERELHSPERWRQMWLAARATLADRERPAYNRWDPDDPLCA